MDNLKVKKLHPKAKTPFRANKFDSGLDMYALEDYYLEPHSSALVSTGIAIELGKGFEGQVRPKSGITAKTGLRVQLGTVDYGYTGEIKVMVDNIYPHKVKVEKGKKIAQLVITPVTYPMVEVVEKFKNINKCSRGENGFGSTGLD